MDPARVAAAGNSQGGGLALAVAGLVDDLAALLTTAPFLCDVQRGIELTDASPYGEIARYLAVHREAEEAVRHTLSYVDGVTFARRATAPAHFGIGLRDNVCPPSTGFAAYNQYGAANGRADAPSRHLHTYPFNGHEGGEALAGRAAAALARRAAPTGHRPRGGVTAGRQRPTPVTGSPRPVRSSVRQVTRASSLTDVARC